MTVRPLVLSLVLNVVLAGALAWDHAQRRQLGSQVQQLRQVADSTATDAVARVADAQQRAMLAEGQITVLEGRVARAQDSVAALAASQDAQADTIVLAAATGDTAAVRVEVRQMQAQHEEERLQWGLVVRSKDLVIAELRAVDVTRVDAIRGLEQALAARDAVINAMPQPPGWWERNDQWVSAGVAALVAWKTAGR